ncbi:hypothetical protein LSAT2_002724, partial [Lamellibrachia satsuma]
MQGAGTDADVFIELYETAANCLNKKLDTPANDFNEGIPDVLQQRVVGEWDQMAHFVRDSVHDQGLHQGRFFLAGTDAKVQIALQNQKSSFLITLNGDFGPGSVATFFKSVVTMCPLKKVIIGHNNAGTGPEWNLDKIYVYNQATDMSYECCQLAGVVNVTWFSSSEMPRCHFGDIHKSYITGECISGRSVRGSCTQRYELEERESENLRRVRIRELEESENQRT